MVVNQPESVPWIYLSVLVVNCSGEQSSSTAKGDQHRAVHLLQLWSLQYVLGHIVKRESFHITQYFTILKPKQQIF